MKLPVVSIVGRPNVGKSTLFNRIIRRREAIVDDAPGITRDRKYGETEWEGVWFTLVDTGGYIPKTRDVIEAGVTHQVRLAIEEADCILFLTDCSTGITNVDDQVAKILRKSGKPCVLAVNKVDRSSQEADAAVFIRLGLGEPLTVSGMRGRGIGDMLSIVIKRLGPVSQGSTPSDNGAVRLAVVGKPNVGKSTFINAVLGEERLLVTEIPGTTRDSVDVRLKNGDQEFVLVDTAGMRRRTRVKENVEYYSSLRTRRAGEKCDVAAVFVDADEGLTHQDLRVVSEVVEARKGVLLVVNKWDLLKDDPDRIREFEDNRVFRLQGMDYIPVIVISCKTGLRIDKVLEFAFRIHQERSRRVPSSTLNKLIGDINQRYQPPAVKGKRVRIVYGAQVGTEPPRFAFFSNYPHLIKENYSRFLENQIRDAFGFQGVPLSFIFKRK